MKIKTEANGPIIQRAKSEFFVHHINPYIGCEFRCSYCNIYNGGHPEDEVILPKDFIERMGGEITSYKPQIMGLGWQTDTYQRVEDLCHYTRQALKVLTKKQFAVSILTKSELVLRDLSFFQKMPGSSIGVSFSFHEEKDRQFFEPKTSTNEERLVILESLKKAGVETFAVIGPVMPYITQVDSLIQLVATFADTIWVKPLQLINESAPSWGKILPILKAHYPEYIESYRQIVFNKNHTYWDECKRKMERVQNKYGVRLKIRL